MMRDRVSEITVAPTVTVIGSSLEAPSRATIELPSSVWEASNDPSTTAASGP